MRPVIRNRPQLDPVLQDTLDGIVIPIQAGWKKQHQGDGAHTDITATSATITGLTTLGKVRLSYVIWNDDGVAGNHNNITVAGLADVSWLRIFPGQSLGADLEITGIDATGRETGDLLLVTNCDSGTATGNDILFHIEDANSTAENRFAASLTNAPASPFTLEASRGVWLIYDYDTANFAGPREPRWRIIDGA